MSLSALATLAALLVAPSLTRSDDGRLERVRAALVAAVVERLGHAADVAVDILDAPAQLDAVEALTATPASGARVGRPIRFTISPSSGRAFTVLAQVSATVGHAVAARALARGTAIEAADVEWRQARVDGVLLEGLPALQEVLGAHTRRSIAAGAVLNRAALVRPFAVRAGDTVAMTVRAGAVEVRGVGRAVSSGFVGDVIRILPPGTRQPSRARVVGPAAVEVLR